jgi:signal transduction histidine kinase/Tfp pilus assembly protein PilF
MVVSLLPRNLVLTIIFFVGISVSALPFSKYQDIDSLYEIIITPQSPDSTRFNAYLSLAQLLQTTQPARSMEYAHNALEIASRLRKKDKIAAALTNLGTIYWHKGNFNHALDYHLQALNLYNETGDEAGIATAYTNIGQIFLEQGYYERATDYLFRALLLYEKGGNMTGMAEVLNNLGVISEIQKDYEQAEKYHLQSLAIKQELNDAIGISFSYNNLGLVYQGKQVFDKAMEFFMLALDIRENLGENRQIANTVRNIGFLYYLMKDNNNSRLYLNRALKLYAEVDDNNGLARTYYLLGRLHLQTGETDLSREYFLQSLSTAKELEQNNLITENYSGLATLMAYIGDYRMAFEYQSKVTALKDSIYNDDSFRKTLEIQQMYDHERKESEMELRSKNEQINFLSSQRDRLLRNFLIAGVVLVLISLFLLYNRFLIAKNANSLLEQQKNEITLTNEKLISLNHNLVEQKKKSEELNQQLQLSNQKLQDSEKNLIEINSTKDKFFSIISHDLRNPFAAIVSFSRILKRDIENLTTEELHELALELDKSVLKINNLLENLLQWSRTQTGKIRYQPEYIAIHEIVKENLNLFKNNAREKNITMIDRVDDNTPVWADPNMTDTVIRNLMSNALKYTNEGGRIIISSEIRDHKVYISIEDNGVGMSEASMNKIFRVDTLHSTYGTMDEKGSGLGLLLCKEFVEKQGGDISFQSELNKGTTFTFSLPPEKND